MSCGTILKGIFHVSAISNLVHALIYEPVDHILAHFHGDVHVGSMKPDTPAIVPMQKGSTILLHEQDNVRVLSESVDGLVSGNSSKEQSNHTTQEGCKELLRKPNNFQIWGNTS